MTFAETQKVIDAINEIESWTKGVQRIEADSDPDWELLKKYKNWLEEAKQTVFELCIK